MKVAILIRREEEVAAWGAWARWIGGPAAELLLVRVDPKAQEVRHPVDPEGDLAAACSVLEVMPAVDGDAEAETACGAVTVAVVPTGPNARMIEQAIGLGRNDLWLLPWGERVDRMPPLERDLFEHGEAAFAAIRWGDDPPAGRSRLLVPVLDEAPGRRLLRFAEEAAGASELRALAVQAQRPIGPDSEEVARLRLQHRMAAAFDRGTPGALESLVSLANSTEEAVAGLLDHQQDVVIWGVVRENELQRALFGKVAKRMTDDGELPPIIAFRAGARLSGRMMADLDRLLGGTLPQLERAERLALFERLETSSRFDVDFITLITLATGIAALGLVLNSPAVIIGAMLVAPLMTPLVGSGFALAQGNLALARNAASTVVSGFALAIVVGLLAGWLSGSTEPTSEMLARGNPGPLDLLVALASGVAAAYASARSNLSSALPGVAIAAALVPPIATAGIALSCGATVLSEGAAVLFLANMVAIIFGSAAMLWAMGVRAAHDHGSVTRWGRRAFVIVGLITLALTYGLGERFDSRDDRELATIARVAARPMIEDVDDVRIDAVRVDRSGDDGVVIHVALVSTDVPSKDLLDGTALAILSSIEHAAEVRFTTRLESRVRSR